MYLLSYAYHIYFFSYLFPSACRIQQLRSVILVFLLFLHSTSTITKLKNAYISSILCLSYLFLLQPVSLGLKNPAATLSPPRLLGRLNTMKITYFLRICKLPVIFISLSFGTQPFHPLSAGRAGRNGRSCITAATLFPAGLHSRTHQKHILHNLFLKNTYITCGIALYFAALVAHAHLITLLLFVLYLRVFRAPLFPGNDPR